MDYSLQNAKTADMLKDMLAKYCLTVWWPTKGWRIHKDYKDYRLQTIGITRTYKLTKRQLNSNNFRRTGTRFGVYYQI